MNSTRPTAELLRAFSSYSWSAAEDVESIERLACELRLRGFTVFRDRESMIAGGSLEETIRRELARSALVMPLLTPHSLVSDPVVKLEFKTARELHRETGRPALVPVVRNLGTDHAAITQSTWERLKHDFGAHWTQIASAGEGPLAPSELAGFAAEGLRAALAPAQGPADGRWRLGVATRGERPAGQELLIDATELLGGAEPSAGCGEDWARFAAGVRDLERVLGEHGGRHEIEIEPHCHLSAALAVGHAFRFAAGWKLSVRAGADTFGRGEAEQGTLVAKVEHGAFAASGGTLAVIVDLVPRQIYRCARDSFAEPPRAVAEFTRPAGARLGTEDCASAACWVAQQIKRLRDELRAERVDLYLCVPAPFAVLLGAELGALGCPVRLHEHEQDTYIESIELTG